jgi:hypothetical protein
MHGNLYTSFVMTFVTIITLVLYDGTLAGGGRGDWILDIIVTE